MADTDEVDALTDAWQPSFATCSTSTLFWQWETFSSRIRSRQIPHHSRDVYCVSCGQMMPNGLVLFNICKVCSEFPSGLQPRSHILSGWTLRAWLRNWKLHSDKLLRCSVVGFVLGQVCQRDLRPARCCGCESGLRHSWRGPWKWFADWILYQSIIIYTI